MHSFLKIMKIEKCWCLDSCLEYDQDNIKDLGYCYDLIIVEHYYSNECVVVIGSMIFRLMQVCLIKFA